LRADLAPHACVARCASLERRDADHVVERHPQGEEARRLAQHAGAVRTRGVACALGRVDARQALDIQVAVARVLELDDARMPERDHIARRGGKRSQARVRTVATRSSGIGVAGGMRLADALRCVLRRCDGGKAAREAAQARVDADISRAHGVLERSAHDRQHAAGGDGAKEHAAHHRARIARDCVHVERVEAPARCARRVEQALRVEAAVALRHLLGRGERAAGRRDQPRPIPAHVACLQHAPGLEQFGRDGKIHAPGHRIEAEHRHTSAERRARRGKHFDVIGRCAGALRDAGNRRALRDVSGTGGGFDEPLGQHAAPLAAERADQDRDGSFDHVCAGCIALMTARRARSAMHSSKPALTIVSPR
jgi:hypothetical protein